MLSIERTNIQWLMKLAIKKYQRGGSGYLYVRWIELQGAKDGLGRWPSLL